jgi:chitin disaccharide deacetylase
MLGRTMATPRHMVLCADDYGLTEGVSRGILDLAARGRLSATSAMSTMAAWPRLAPDLKKLGGSFAVGLHLNLTVGSPLGAMPSLAPGGVFPPLAAVIRSAFTGQLPEEELRAEIGRQLDVFERAYGAPPAFIDGHQHVHVLPVIRHLLLQVIMAKGLAGRLWLRDPSDGLMPIIRRKLGSNKALVVKFLGIGFRRAARQAGIDTNEGFSGFSPLDAGTSAERVFQRALIELGPRPVMMCHPGHVDSDLRGLDPAVESRPLELAYLASAAFGDLLREHGMTLAPRP